MTILFNPPTPRNDNWMHPLFSGTHSWPPPEVRVLSDDNSLDNLFIKMMTYTPKVIVPCKFCSANNAVTNPCCCQCGAPMGVK